jgi:hypothetical protein
MGERYEKTSLQHKKMGPALGYLYAKTSVVTGLGLFFGGM